MLIIAAVVTALPAVAMADVMITSNVGIQASQNQNQIHVIWGLNYKEAHAIGAITYLPPPDSTGTIQLAGMQTANTSMVNVLTVWMNQTTATTNGTIWVNFTSSSMPSNVLVLVSSDDAIGPQTFSMLQQNGQSIDSASFHFKVTDGVNLDVGFYLPAGTYSSSDNANMSITYVS